MRLRFFDQDGKQLTHEKNYTTDLAHLWITPFIQIEYRDVIFKEKF